VTGPSFRFRLERVRALRERREDLARQALAVAIAGRCGSEERLRAVDADLERARAEQRRATQPAAGVSAAELQARQAFVEHVEAQRVAGARELQHQEGLLAARTGELGEAARDREMLERLKERHRSEHAREQARRESNVLDELATYRFGRSAA
jgi:flagellar FliJ protein